MTIPTALVNKAIGYAQTEIMALRAIADPASVPVATARVLVDPDYKGGGLRFDGLSIGSGWVVHEGVADFLQAVGGPLSDEDWRTVSDQLEATLEGDGDLRYADFLVMWLRILFAPRQR